MLVAENTACITPFAASVIAHVAVAEIAEMSGEVRNWAAYVRLVMFTGVDPSEVMVT